MIYELNNKNRTSYFVHRTSRVRGITLIELLIIIAILGILGASTTPLVGKFILRNEYQITTDKVISIIRKAQGYAMDNKNDSTWGVCTTGSVMRLFQGTCGTPVFSEDFVIPATITISGLTTTTFNRRGEPNPSNGLTSVIVSTNIGSMSATMNSSGGLMIN